VDPDPGSGTDAFAIVGSEISFFRLRIPDSQAISKTIFGYKKNLDKIFPPYSF
jgi:hypothetical protein